MMIVQERRLCEQVLGVEGREERFEEFHLGQLSLEGVPEEDAKVFRGREEGCELQDLREDRKRGGPSARLSDTYPGRQG